jgi:predicted nucleotidyltransferase
VRVARIRPAEIAARLSTLGDAIARASEDVEFAYLFGSAATGSLTPGSDIDVAVHVAPSKDAYMAQRLVAAAVAAQLGTDAVDVVLLNTAPLALSGRVLGSRKVLLDRAPLSRHRYESVTARMFQDFRVREHRLLAQRYHRG